MHAEDGYPIKKLCRVLNLNRSSYYKWLRRSKSRQELTNEALLQDLSGLYKEYNGIYGYRRLADELNARQQSNHSYNRIYRLTRLLGIKAVIRKKRPAYRRNRPEITAENILNRNFSANEINEKWLTDVTEFSFGNSKKLYLSAILDLKDRSIVAYSISEKNNNELVFSTFDKAVTKFPEAQPIFHSDRGSQYTSKEFKSRLNESGMIQSMSRVGRCIDNGPMEGFWGIIKSEMYYLNRFADYESLERAIGDYIDFYNYKRRQKKLDYLAPMIYRNKLQEIA